MAVACIVTGGGCISLNPDNLRPQSITPVTSDKRFAGTVNVQAFVPHISKGKVNLSFNGSLSGRVRVASEQAIAQKGLFQRIEQGDADYVLDIWIIDATHELKQFGEGYVIDISTIWRLTRTKDGKVIICDFANGHGAARAVGTNAHVLAMEASSRDMIQKGLSALSGSSTSLAAMYMAEDWPSMGPAIPEGYKNLKENLSKIRAGLMEEEVRKMIPSMANVVREVSGQSVVYKSPVFDQTLVNNELREVPSFYFPFRTLLFIDGKLIQWELNKGGFSNLNIVAMQGHREIAEVLIAKGTGTNSAYTGGMSPLHHAAAAGQVETAKMLIAKGAFLNVQTMDYVEEWARVRISGSEYSERIVSSRRFIEGRAPLHLAASNGHKEMSELLIASGAKVDLRDNYGNTALHFAAANNRRNVAEVLVGKGADINARVSNGATPLHTAAMWGNKDVMEFLIIKGAEINAKNEKGLTPLSLANKNKSSEVAEYLRKHGGVE